MFCPQSMRVGSQALSAEHECGANVPRGEAVGKQTEAACVGVLVLMNGIVALTVIMVEA